MSELGQTANELKDLPANLRTNILSGLARLKAADLVTGLNAFQRDQERLDAKQRAYYRKMGLEVKEDDDVGINNYLGDVTITEGGGNQSSPQPTATQPSEPGQTNGKGRRWLPWLLATSLVAGNVGFGYWLTNNLPTTDTDTLTTIELSVDE